MLLKDDIDLALKRSERVIKISHNNTSYWLKKSVIESRGFSYAMLNVVAKLSQLPIIKAVPKPQGNKALLLEQQRILNLKAHGIKVPDIVDKHESWLLLSDLGSTLSSFYTQCNDQSLRRQVLHATLDQLQTLHNKELYLSQAVTRNITININTLEVGFIDFEDDPLTVMPLSQAIARDLLLFLTSVARFFTKDSHFFTTTVSSWLSEYTDEINNYLLIFADKFSWLKQLPFKHKLGKDLEKILMSLAVIEQIPFVATTEGISAS